MQTIIPVLAIPVSIIGSFAGMYALGYSINLLTLLGLVLAIGIVVDDAIIVIENVDRIHSEHDISVKDATIKAMQEVTGPVVAIVLVWRMGVYSSLLYGWIYGTNVPTICDYDCYFRRYLRYGCTYIDSCLMCYFSQKARAKTVLVCKEI